MSSNPYEPSVITGHFTSEDGQRLLFLNRSTNHQQTITLPEHLPTGRSSWSRAAGVAVNVFIASLQWTAATWKGKISNKYQNTAPTPRLISLKTDQLRSSSTTATVMCVCSSIHASDWHTRTLCKCMPNELAYNSH